MFGEGFQCFCAQVVLRVQALTLIAEVAPAAVASLRVDAACVGSAAGRPTHALVNVNAAGGPLVPAHNRVQASCCETV